MIAPFSKHADDWWKAACVNVHDGKAYTLAPQQTPQFDKVIPQTFEQVLRLYAYHPESKSLAPDGSPCSTHTRGLLKRAHVQALGRRFVGKETDRRWEHGGDLSVFRPRGVEYQTESKMTAVDPTVQAQAKAIGLRDLMRRTGLSQHTLEAIRKGRPVRTKTVLQLLAAIAH